MGYERKGIAYKQPTKYEPIHMPKNTAAGVIISAFCLIFGFAMVWHIWWLAIIGFAGIIATWIGKSFDDNVDYYVPVEEIKRIENQHYDELKKQVSSMSTNSIAKQHIAHENHGHHDIGATKVFGFWIYLMSDLILFACLFATYVVLVNGTAGGPTGKDIFNLNFVLIETFLLLFSSITYGFAMLAMYKQKINLVKLWLLITFTRIRFCYHGNLRIP